MSSHLPGTRVPAPMAERRVRSRKGRALRTGMMTETLTGALFLGVQFTVVIPTYRRADLLRTTLDTLHRQTLSIEHYRLLVVDNADDPATTTLCREYGLDRVVEPSTGLSHAKNRGWREATTEWVLYLDDDIRAPTDLLARFYDRLRTADYAGLGGRYRHFFLEPPPNWLRKYYADDRRPSDQREFGELPAGRYLSGGIMAVRRAALRAVGGFSADHGMNGGKVGYAEEEWTQWRLRQGGYRIFYDPDIYMDHLVQPYKYTVAARLRMAYASGRDSAGLPEHGDRHTPVTYAARLLDIAVRSLPFNVARLLLKPGYRWQNCVVDTLTKVWYATGRLNAR